MAKTNEPKANATAMPVRAGLWLCVLLGALSGCNNAYEQVSVGKWREISPEAAAALPTTLAVETTQPGSGRAVRPGDFVRARLHPAVAVPSADPQADIVWLWIGVDPIVERAASSRRAEFGWLGSQDLRNAFVGHRLHEKFTLKSAADARRLTTWAPARGFMVFMSSEARPTDTVGTLSPLWSATDIGTLAEVEILQICKAKLFRRTAYLQQWGVIFGWGDIKPQSVRSGTLGWSKIDASCPSPTGTFTVQVGPLYSGEEHYPGELYEWWDSYRRLRPPGLFEEEWAAPLLPR
jgi:hypothetical protein